VPRPRIRTDIARYSDERLFVGWFGSLKRAWELLEVRDKHEIGYSDWVRAFREGHRPDVIVKVGEIANDLRKTGYKPKVE
jgi:hypothetical protein